jgi:hypothetical protein
MQRITPFIPKYSLISKIYPLCKNLSAGIPPKTKQFDKTNDYYNKIFKSEYIDTVSKHDITINNVFNENLIVTNKYQKLDLITELKNELSISTKTKNFEEQIEIFNLDNKSVLIYELRQDDKLVLKKQIQNYNPEQHYLANHDELWLSSWYQIKDIVDKLK